MESMEPTPFQTNPNPEQDFTEFVHEKRPHYVGRNGRQEYKSYIPSHEIIGYWRDHKIREVLKAYQPRLYADTQDIRSHLSLTFSTLVYIGKVKYLRIFLQRGIDDNQLPLESRPAALEGPIYDELWEKLYKEQWTFFPLLIGGRFTLTDRHLSPDHILPFESETLLKSGDSARVSLVQVQESCNQSHQTCHEVPNTIVLKTYTDKRFEKLYRNELAALEFLKEQRHDNIIKYYGSFSQNGTFNLFLEYANGGNLLDFFNNNEPPRKPKDIHMFWNGIFGILKGLHVVHQSKPDVDGSSHFRGIHEDIKPDNILLTKGPSDNLYDFSCILADFGYSHIRNENEGLGIDRHGNHDYSAPEASHHSSLLQKGTNHIDSSADIFSAGGLISDAASWLSFGPGGREKYRTERINASKFEDQGHRGCFHDGVERLKAVDQTHEDIRDECKYFNDTLTPKILNLVEECMLVRTRLRLSAREIATKFDDILRQPLDETVLLSKLALDTSPSSRPVDHSRAASNGTSVDSAEGSSFNSFIAPCHSSSTPTTPIRLHTSDYILDTRRSSAVNGSSPTGPTSLGCSSPSSSPSPWHYSQTTKRPAMLSHGSNGWELSKLAQKEYQVSMEQAHAWRRAKKGEGIPLDRNIDRNVRMLQSQLNNRDHIFFIDNSPTMLQHKAELEKVFYTMAYMSKSMDDNGIELVLASKIKNSLDPPRRDVTPLLRILETCEYDHGGGFMEENFGYLVEKVILPKLPKLPRLSRSISDYFRKSKPMSIFVLTDGCWDVCGVEREIRNLMNHCKDRKLSRTKVSIQFLRFGADENGISNLEYLDEFGKDEEYDVVDTRSVTDDSVTHMFIGSINPNFDSEKTSDPSPT